MLRKLAENAVARKIAGFLGAVPGAIRAHLNTVEIARIAAATLLSGGTVWGVLEVLATKIPEWVSPDYASVVTALFILLFEVRRRLGQGTPLVPED
jgi:hypothetical protein